MGCQGDRERQRKMTLHPSQSRFRLAGSLSPDSHAFVLTFELGTSSCGVR